MTEGTEGMNYALRDKGGKLSGFIHLDVKPFTDVKDSAGAGDWFSAGFITQFLREHPHPTDDIYGDDVEVALSAGYEASRIACSAIGALGAILRDLRNPEPTVNARCRYCLA